MCEHMRQPRPSRIDCPACWSRETRRRNAAAAEHASAAGLPDLTGTLRQVGWGNTIRRGLVRRVGEVVAAHPLAAGHPDPAADLVLVGAVADHLEENPDPGLVADAADASQVAAVLRVYCHLIRASDRAAWWIDHRDRLRYDALSRLPDLIPAGGGDPCE